MQVGVTSHCLVKEKIGMVTCFDIPQTQILQMVNGVFFSM